MVSLKRRWRTGPDHVRRGDSLCNDDREFLEAYWAAPIVWHKTFFLCHEDGRLNRSKPRPFTQSEARDWRWFVE